MTTSADEIPFVLQEYVDEARAIENELIEITWYMRGGINLDQAYQLTAKERKHIHKVIKDNIERTKKSGIGLL